MHKELLFTYISQEIINMAFTPTGNYGKWINKWFVNYFNGIDKFLGLNGQPVPKRQIDHATGSIENDWELLIHNMRLHLKITYRYNDNWSNIYTIFSEKKETIEACSHVWIHDIYPWSDSFCVCTKFLFCTALEKNDPNYKISPEKLNEVP